MKVFSGRKWLDKMSMYTDWSIIEKCVNEGWVGRCDGMTEKELKKDGRSVIPQLMIEEQLYIPLKK